ncbi:MAG: DUF2852 domain-containing protein [Paracoccus sp. (in: a-proteobacteria)]
MHSASQTWPAYQLPQQRGNGPLGRARDWLDERGKPAWIVAMILGFVAFWPVGLAILGYLIWSKRMFGNRSCAMRSHRSSPSAAPTGNVAFDAYREETLKRLEDEHREFLDFLAKLREAKDKAEFDQFMAQRDPKSGE